MNFIKNSSLGFNDKAVIEVNFNGDSIANHRYTLIRDELMKDPAILNVSEHESNIVGGLGNGWTTTENNKGEEVSTSIYRMNVDADYFDTYSMKLIAGRFFSKQFPTDSAKSVLVNESAVKTFGWPTAASAIGKPFGKGNDRKYVIGVMKDFNYNSLHNEIKPLELDYEANKDWFNKMTIAVNSDNYKSVLKKIETVWNKNLPSVPFEYQFLDDVVQNQYESEVTLGNIINSFTLMAILISSLGLFGLASFSAEQRSKEIGIRKVLGASVSGIVQLLSKDFLKLVLISFVIATPIGWWAMNKWLQGFNYRVTIAWWMFAMAGLIAILIAMTTVSFQALKAAITNPTKSLRSE